MRSKPDPVDQPERTAHYDCAILCNVHCWNASTKHRDSSVNIPLSPDQHHCSDEAKWRIGGLPHPVHTYMFYIYVCVCVRAYVCIYTYVYDTYLHTYVILRIRIYLHIYVRTYICQVCVHTYIQTHTYILTYIHICTYINIRPSVLICVNTHTYIYRPTYICYTNCHPIHCVMWRSLC